MSEKLIYKLHNKAVQHRQKNWLDLATRSQRALTHRTFLAETHLL